MTVAYDGAPFHGFAESEDVETVMGVLREALERIARVPCNLVGAGRTDTGVHGWGQVVSGDLPDRFDPVDLQHRLNSMCRPHIAVRDMHWVDDPMFNARYSAQWRHYRYLVLNATDPVPFLAGTAWHVERPLNLWAMQLACDPIIGEHDFTAFCRRPKPIEGERERSMNRLVMQAGWRKVSDEHSDALLRFEIRANAFCHQMVRALVGTMVDVGLGKMVAGDVRSVLMGRDRSVAGQVAPAHGLCLWEVGY